MTDLSPVFWTSFRILVQRAIVFLSIYFPALISLVCAPTGAYFVPARLEQSGNPYSSGLRRDQVEDPDLSGQKVVKAKKHFYSILYKFIVNV